MKVKKSTAKTTKNINPNSGTEYEIFKGRNHNVLGLPAWKENA